LKRGHLTIAKSEPQAEVSPYEALERRMEDFLRRPFSMMPWWSQGPSLADELSPVVDIYEKGGDIVLRAEVPGIRKEDIHVDVKDRTLTIAGEKRKEEKTERKDYYRLESSYGSFVRSFTLPSDVQPDKARASCADGVLEIRIPKTEEAKSRTRQVRVE